MVRTAKFPQPRKHVDPIRIAAISAAIAVNLGLLALLMVPLDYSARPERPDTSTTVRFIDPPKPVVVVKTVDPKPTLPTVITRTVVPQQPQPPPVVVASNPGPVDPPLPPSQPPADPVGSGVSSTPVEASLSPIASPAPTYPRNALRDEITGTVELELLVGVDGRVLEVHVTHSSGNHELDFAARDQVLHNWRFQPAQRGGVAVQALGRVPIVFTLDGR